MMIKYSDNRDTRTPLVAGNYVGELFKVEYHPTPEEVAQGKIPQFGPYLTFVFKMLEPVEYANNFRSGICSAKRHPKSKLTAWLQAFGLTMAQLGEQLDESLLLGKQVRLRLDPDDSGQLKITAVGPLSGPAPVPLTAAVGFKPAAKSATPKPPLSSTPVSAAPSVKVAEVSTSSTSTVSLGSPNLPADGMDDIPF